MYGRRLIAANDLRSAGHAGELRRVIIRGTRPVQTAEPPSRAKTHVIKSRPYVRHVITSEGVEETMT